MEFHRPEGLAREIRRHWLRQNSVQLRHALEQTFGDSTDHDPHVEAVIAAVFATLTDKQAAQFRQELNNFQRERLWSQQRRRRNERATRRFLKRQTIAANCCDVICIASNEGPYIAEFIHHYLAQGFSNLFIGLNNDSSGQTGPIVEAIAAHYPQVHLINTDRAHRRGQQRASYGSLYNHASRESSSSHCLIVDVDEYWVANPLRLSINAFLAQHADADVISFNWLHCHGSSLFGNPLDLSNTQLRLTDQFKSLFRYGIPITDLGAHAPTVLGEVRHIVSGGKEVRSRNTSSSHSHQLRKRGVAVRPDQQLSGWVIHRHTRSDLEHAAKLLRPHANQDAAVPFKSNRNGAPPREESAASRQLAQALLGDERGAPEPYRQSLATFISECSIADAIDRARSSINEATIRAQIEAIPPAVVQANRLIWKRSFRRSRFLEQLKQRAKLNGSQPSSGEAV